jgi:hypothetical protein
MNQAEADQRVLADGAFDSKALTMVTIDSVSEKPSDSAAKEQGSMRHKIRTAEPDRGLL